VAILGNCLSFLEESECFTNLNRKERKHPSLISLNTSGMLLYTLETAVMVSRNWLFNEKIPN